MVDLQGLTLEPGQAPELLPAGAAVYLIEPPEGRPHLGRTAMLRRRAARLYQRWNLHAIGARLRYWPVASKLEQWIVSYHLARHWFPDDYSRVLKLPRQTYVKLVLNNPFPRTQITTRLQGTQSLFFGPFSARTAADQFESHFLDLFQLRRCQEDLAPSPDHPGCIYGEMLRCLRPCQGAVSADEYASEAMRVAGFLSTRGGSLQDSAAAARDRAAAELEFEEAARQHARVEKITHIVRDAGELARDISRLHGIAVTLSMEHYSVLLWFFHSGVWLPPAVLSLAPGIPTPLDRRLRDAVGAIAAPSHTSLSLRQDHLALLAKWFYSSWRDGEWLAVDDWNAVSYRKLVNAIHRIITGRADGQMALPLS